MQNVIRTKRFRLISIRLDAVASTGREFSFQDQDDLRDAIIDGVETFSEADAPYDQQGNPVVTIADASNLSVCITEGSTDKVRYIPYNPMRTVINGGIVRMYDNLRPTWPQCRIRVNNTLASPIATYALVGVHFHYPGE